MDLISIIVPVYNVENYVRDCVESILNQSYKNIEIILVDDGSNDKSGKICDDLSVLDNRIITFHKENGGLSDARNFGINKANGEFIMFVDSDDAIDKDIIKILYSLLQRDKQIDLAVCSLERFEDGSKPKFIHKNKSYELDRNKSIEEFLYQKKISTSSCGKLYKKELIENIYFVKNQRFEDNEFIFKVLLNANKVAVCESKLYAYRFRLNSITTSKFDKKDFDIIKIGKKIIATTKNLNENLKIAGITYQCTNCFRIYLNASNDFLNTKEYRYCLNFLNKNSNKVIIRSKSRIKFKLALIFFKINVPNYFFTFIKSLTRF